MKLRIFTWITMGYRIPFVWSVYIVMVTLTGGQRRCTKGEYDTHMHIHIHTHLVEMFA